jgi:hypothetical protein
LNLNVAYESVTSAGSEPLWLLNSTFLQIGNVSLPNSNFWTFCTFCTSGIDQENCIDIESTKVKSLLFSIPLQGNYSIRAFNEALIGFLGIDTDLSPFDVLSNFSFVSNAYFIPDCSPAARKCQTPANSPTGSPTSPESSGLNSGAVIGIVTGSVVIFVLLLGVSIFFFHHRNAKKGEESSSEPDGIFVV